MNAAAVEIVRTLRQQNHQAYLVGGCVRDELMSRQPKDWDLEVYGIDSSRLRGLLDRFGEVNVVGEAFTVYKLGADSITRAIEMLLNHEQLAVQDADVVAAALEHYRKKPSLGFSDCLVLEASRKAGHVPLGTFDSNLGKLNGAQRL